MSDSINNAGEPPLSRMEAAEILLSLSDTPPHLQVQPAEANAAPSERRELGFAFIYDTRPHAADLANFRPTESAPVLTAPGEIITDTTPAPTFPHTPEQLEGDSSSDTDRQQDRPSITHWVCPMCYLFRANNSGVTYSDGRTLTAHITSVHAPLLPTDPRSLVELFADFRRILLERQPGFGC